MVLCVREKYYATNYYNPILNAVEKTCPEIAQERNNPNSKRLRGDELLHILCEGKCERLYKEKDHGKCIYCFGKLSCLA